MDEVELFIDRRFACKQDNLCQCNWQYGNCYWFAYILCGRFKKLSIYYLPIDGHFVAGDGTNFYDSTGRVILSETPMLLDSIRMEDDLWYERIKEDCIN